LLIACVILLLVTDPRYSYVVVREQYRCIHESTPAHL